MAIASGDGYSVGEIDDMGTEPGVSQGATRARGDRVRRQRDRAPGGIETGFHLHERQQELYIVLAGGSRSSSATAPSTPSGRRDRPRRRAHPPQARNSGAGDATYVIVGAEGGYVGRDGRCPRASSPRGGQAPRRLTVPGAPGVHTAYLTFQTSERREFVRITDEVQAAVDESRIPEGMALVSAMHITAGVWVNDDEPGIQADALEWLDKLAPPSWREPANDVADSSHPTPATTATTAAARTTATPTSRTCSSTTR